MANTWNEIKKKLRRKRLKMQKARLAREKAKQEGGAEESYQSRLNRHKREVLRRTILIAAAAAALIFLVITYFEKRSFHDYKILRTSEQEDVVSTQYVEMDGKILRYSPDEVSLVSKNLETIWSTTCDMQNPVADVCGGRAVIADKDGMTIQIYGEDGMTGSVTTSCAIVKARVSKSGLVAVILDGGDVAWINFYSTDGSLIAENQTLIDDPGYPMDVAISDDGVIMMVAYQFVDGGETTSYVAFYNFGDVGQNEDDRIVSGYTYEGIVVPQVQYLSGSRSVALRDDGFSLYNGRQIPKEGETVSVEKEIVSTFYDEDTIGLVFKNDSKDKMYTMEVYNAGGKLKFQKDFNIPYTTVKMSGGYILMYNSSQICIYNGNGVEKYMGSVDGTIRDFFKIGWNRYLLVMDSGVNVIKLG